MTQISITPPTNGNTADANVVATALNTIVNEINGNLDSSNIKDGSIANASLQGGVTPAKLTNPYCFSAYCSTGKSLSTGAAIVDLQTELFDPNNNFASSRYTAPVTGIYQINAQAFWGISGAGPTENAVIYLKKNGSATGMPVSQIENGSGDGYKLIRPSISYTVQLTAGDYIELWITTVGSRDLVADIRYTWMNGFLVTQTA